MFSAVSKYVRAVWYLMTFRVDKASETLRMNPGVISANYDRILKEKKASLNQYKDAISAMVAQEETKKQKLRSLNEEIERLQKLKAGAAAKAKQLAAKHNGDPVAARNDPEFMRCQTAFQDFSSTLDEKQERAAELESDLEILVKNVSGHQTQIQSLMRDLEKLKEEKHEAVADVLSAREEEQIADMMTGLSNDRTSEELRELRELRQKAGAKARVSRELAGLDTKRAEADFMEYAQNSTSNDEFDALIGLSDAKPTTETPQNDARLPE
jgi:chromosome segregation ATPase